MKLIVVVVGKFYEYKLLNGGIIWYLNSISIKLLKRKKAKTKQALQLLPCLVGTLILGILSPHLRNLS